MIRSFLPKRVLNFYHFCLAGLGALLYRFPSEKIIVLGVTGTNGKTTTVLMLAKILREAGFRVAESSSIHFQIGSEEKPNLLKQTMPGRFFLQKFLRQAVSQKCQFAVIEVTSEGICQYRHKFINWDGAVLINLAPEHIESHGSFNAYKNAKLDFFAAVARSKPKYFSGQIFKKFLAVSKEVKEAEDFLNFPKVVKLTFCPQDWQGLDLKIPGDFFLTDASAALCAAKYCGIDLKTALRTLNSISVIPGRMEELANPFGFRIFVDYAHTPNALESVYQSVSEFKFSSNSKTEKVDEQSPKLICVLGAAGGGRDKWKRSEFGKIAGKWCDQIILTNEDPYNENPEEILSQIKSGISDSSKTHEILDRREALKKALVEARAGDVVIVTGKGSEPWMMVGQQKVLWDDRQILKELFSEVG